MMATAQTDIWVYAHWKGLDLPVCIGVLSLQQARGKRAWSFAYEREWLQAKSQVLLDPDITWFGGPQYPVKKENFGVFLDAMPDTWGRRIMQRRAALEARRDGLTARNLYDLDYLLGVYDITRMGALRFKLDPDGPFLDDSHQNPAPPITTVRALQHSAALFETGEADEQALETLSVLLAPGSSLGGARPKASVSDADGHLWIAKFPSQNDRMDKAAWEYLASRLAKKCGIEMAPVWIEKIAGNHHTFFTKRFDRQGQYRIHFSSAMTMTGYSEESLRDHTASYLDIAEFIQLNGADIRNDLHRLWRRIVFSIAISNTDDHLRNHGFLLTRGGWVLSPAFDLNPSVEKSGLSLTIDMQDNALDFELARSVGQWFQLTKTEMDTIIAEVKTAVSTWPDEALQAGISRWERETMAQAFRYT